MKTELPLLKKDTGKFGHYTLDARHINGCVIRQVNDIPPSRLKEFMQLVQKFIAQADDRENSIEITMNVFKEALALGQKTCLYTVEKNNILRGYLIAQVLPTLYGSLCTVIHQLFLDRAVRSLKIARELEQLGVRWSRQNGATEMVFATRRNAEAFKRLLGTRWEVYSVMLKRKI